MFINYLHRSGEMRSRRRWHTQKWYHPSPQQRYFGAQKPKKRAKVQQKKQMCKFFQKKMCFYVKK